MADLLKYKLELVRGISLVDGFHRLAVTGPAVSSPVGIQRRASVSVCSCLSLIFNYRSFCSENLSKK